MNDVTNLIEDLFSSGGNDFWLTVCPNTVMATVLAPSSEEEIKVHHHLGVRAQFTTTLNTEQPIRLHGGSGRPAAVDLS